VDHPGKQHGQYGTDHGSHHCGGPGVVNLVGMRPAASDIAEVADRCCTSVARIEHEEGPWPACLQFRGLFSSSGRQDLNRPRSGGWRRLPWVRSACRGRCTKLPSVRSVPPRQPPDALAH
jgi:hypothetical protein